MKKNAIIYMLIIGFLMIGLAVAGMIAINTLHDSSNLSQRGNDITSTYASFPNENLEENVFTTPIILNSTPTETPWISIPINTLEEATLQLLPDSTGTREFTETPAPHQIATTQTPASTETPVPTRSSDCDLTGTFQIIIIGQDEGFGLPPYGAEAIRVIKLDFDQDKASIFAFQRDLLLSTPNLESAYGISEAHLGTVYDIVMKREGLRSNARSIATMAISQVLAENFDLTVELFVNMNQNVVPDIIDQIGGIDLNIPTTFSSPTHSFAAGYQHMDGAAAWDYISNPPFDQDEWERMGRQDTLFTALRNRLVDPSIYSHLLDLYEIVSNSVTTNLSIQQVGGLICEMEQIPPENVVFNTFPESMILTKADSSMILNDMNTAKILVFESFNW